MELGFEHWYEGLISKGPAASMFDWENMVSVVRAFLRFRIGEGERLHLQASIQKFKNMRSDNFKNGRSIRDFLSRYQEYGNDLDKLDWVQTEFLVEKSKETVVLLNKLYKVFLIEFNELIHHESSLIESVSSKTSGSLESYLVLDLRRLRKNTAELQLVVSRQYLY